ncbi:hypothetical protein [Chitinophaga defluvii]|uniref:CRISPR-associated protein Cas7 n=1 Tax=Chitinophaga defluvii TaxID=3163343 RepID=A0ABV2T5V9_9BACT
MTPYIYLRALKRAEHTVFCVQDGQKSYWDPQFNTWVAFSSGQQVKRSILDAFTSLLNIPTAPVTFNYNIVVKKDRKELENKEPWSPCDPSYFDQLLGGWMRAGDGITLKRRSPLSISALRPIHPLLARMSKENITFDRSNRPDHHPVNVRMSGSDTLLTEEEIDVFLSENNRTLPRRNWIPDNQRTSGLFVYDVAIDLRTLFSVSLNQHEPELSKEVIEKLQSNGWVASKTTFGKCLVLPKAERDKVIPALAHALINWRITSNQARTFSLMETLAVSISDNANKIAGSIRAKLTDDGERPSAKPIVDESAGTDLYITLPCSSYIVTNNESADALDKATEKLIDMMQSFDYENQII